MCYGCTCLLILGTVDVACLGSPSRSAACPLCPCIAHLLTHTTTYHLVLAQAQFYFAAECSCVYRVVLCVAVFQVHQVPHKATLVEEEAVGTLLDRLRRGQAAAMAAGKLRKEEGGGRSDITIYMGYVRVFYGQRGHPEAAVTAVLLVCL